MEEENISGAGGEHVDDTPNQDQPEVQEENAPAELPHHHDDDEESAGGGPIGDQNEQPKRLYEDGDDEDAQSQPYDHEGEEEMSEQPPMDAEGEYEEEGDYEEEEEDYDPIQKKIQAIIDLCESNSGMYGDTDFPINDSSLYKNPLEPPDYADQCPMVQWMRPQEAVKEEEHVALIKGGATPGDVKQGILGDCWFLGALCVLATRPELLENLFYYNGIQHGFCVFRFFKNGEWQYVFVDTRIPFNKETKTPLYARCADSEEFWVPLIEKAYAKLHKSYEALHGGSMAQAMVDLTGGISEKLFLEAPEVRELFEDSDQLWKDLKKYKQQRFLLGCAKQTKNEDGNQDEDNIQSGIIPNHAFGIQDIREEDGLRLLRIRNPWGHSGWNQKFSDEDEAWDEYKGLRDRLMSGLTEAERNSGGWWMAWEDFYDNFNKIYVCKIFPPTWQQYSITDCWEGNTAGGPYPPFIDRDEEPDQGHVVQDTNDKWFNNPQYRVSVKKKSQVYISLMQEDDKAYTAVNFLVVRTKSKVDRLWEIDKDDIVLEAATHGQVFAQREIQKTVVLTPTYNKKPCHYIIIPNTVGESKKDDERPFFLRLFSSEHIELVKLPNTIEQTFNGAWDKNTCGGKRANENGQENQKWCVNPQYFINLTQPTHLKIILRRKKGGKRTKSALGLCITKAYSPDSPPPVNVIKPNKDGSLPPEA